MTFCLIRSTKDVKISHFLLLKFSGSPKYFYVPPSLVIRRSLLTLSLQVLGVLDANVMDDLARLMNCPDASS